MYDLSDVVNNNQRNKTGHFSLQEACVLHRVWVGN